MIFKMKIIIVFTLSIFFYPLFTTQDDAGVKKPIICNIAGRVWGESNYVFNISQLPGSCDIIDVAQFAFDRDTEVNTHIMESDKGIIRTLVAANKPVYTRIGFTYHDNWRSIFDPPDAHVFQKEKFDPLVNFLNTYKVSGIIINFSSMYDETIHDLAQKVSNFTSTIKEKVDQLKVGIVISGSSYKHFTNDSLFDFAITNKVLDLYIINWSVLNRCKKDTVKTGLSPVTSTNRNLTTIEQVTKSVTNSTMDKLKVYAMVEIIPHIPLNLLPKNALYQITTYSKYCSSTDKANSSQWCINPSSVSYDQGAHAKKFYAGLVLEQLDSDDYESKCDCGQFPVINIIIDGWKGCAINDCPKLDRN